MNPARLGILCVVLLIMGAVAGIAISGQWNAAKVAKAESDAQELKAKADALVSVARQKDVQIASRTSDLAKAEKDIERLKAEYAKVRASKRSLAGFGTPLSPVEPGGVEPGQSGDGALGEAADAVISAQDRLIAEQKAQIADLTASRDAWKGAFEEKDKEAVALRIALDAQKHAAKAGKWVGRLQGFAIGLGVGYAGGKLR